MVHRSSCKHSAWSTTTISCFFVSSTGPHNPTTASIPSQPQQEQTPVVKAAGQGAKPKRKIWRKRLPKLLQPLSPQSYALLCEVVRLATNNCPKLPQLKPLVHEAFPESNILEVHVDISTPPKKIKTLRTNHPCALFDIHGHYSHCFPHLDEFHDCLGVFRDYEATHSGTSTPLPVDFGTIS